MFIKSFYGAVLLCVFVMVPASVFCIECYQCNSEYDPRCGDPFDPYSLGKINCSLKPPLDHMPELVPILCRKNIQKVYGKIRVVRGCGYITDEERDDKACVRRSGTHDVFNFYCSCTGDLCNSGKNILPPGNTVTMMATLIAIMAVVRLNMNLLL